ncbi:LOW QUALITY PROTEIN: protein TASOR [Menidia menidia]
MDDILFRREACRPRRESAAADIGANASAQDGEVVELSPARETHPSAGRGSSAGRRMERRNSTPPQVHQRHMPMEPKKFHIPRKTKEKKALFQHVSMESREYEDMKTVLTSSFIDTNSASCFTYSKPRLVHSEPLEKEFVEKRKEMKSEGRTEKELEESYCFLLANTAELPFLCEKGLVVGHSRITVLGDPNKGVYLSRYSDLLQMNPLTPGTTGEIIIFKVMKGKVKSIYENIKNLMDPTPRFDSHISKNASKVTSLTCYRSFELTQQYFYEYFFDELRQRPRQACPYAVVSFQVKGKDAQITSKPLAPIRLNSQSTESSKGCAEFTVWTGDLVKEKRVLFQICLRSSSCPFLPHRLPEKLEIGHPMRLDQVTKLFPSGLFSYNIYKGSQEVVTEGHCSSLLEVTDRNRSMTSVTKLLQELEMNGAVLVTPLSDRGFLFLLSSVQMATPAERGETWKRCLQALFVFPETRDVARCAARRPSLSHDSWTSGGPVMLRLAEFIPALHHALVKARASPPPKLSLGVELQTREYLNGLKDGSVRQYPMTEYDSKPDDQAQLFSPPKHHRGNMDSYLLSYLSSPTFYLLSVARAKEVVEAHCGPEPPQELRPRNRGGSQNETPDNRAKPSSDQKIQQLLDLILTSKRNAENDLGREEGEGPKAPDRKRKMEQETAERALKYLRASQGHRRPAEGNKVPPKHSPPSAPVSLASVMDSFGLKDLDLKEDGSELTATLIRQLTGLIQAANQNLCEAKEEKLMDSSPFGKLATKLGLPTNCDIDLRKQEELEEQTAGSISSLEGFSPGSQSGDAGQHGAAGRRGGGLWRRAEANEEPEEEWEIPWVLIPITGLCSERYSQRDKNIPLDPRFQHLAVATAISTTTKPLRKSPTLSPEPSPPPSPYQFPFPEGCLLPSPSQCPSPDPSPPLSPSQCPSPEPSPPPSPSQCPSPEPSPAPSPSRSPSRQLAPPTSSAQRLLPETSALPSLPRSLELNQLDPRNRNHSGANEHQLVSPALREFPGISSQTKRQEPVLCTSVHTSKPPSPEQRTRPSSAPTQTLKEADGQAVLDRRLKEGREAERRQAEGEDERDDLVIVLSSDSDQKEEENEPEEGVPPAPPPAGSAPCPRRDIDSIVDKHLGDFSCELQRLLQEESVLYSRPQPPPTPPRRPRAPARAPVHTRVPVLPVRLLLQRQPLRPGLRELSAGQHPQAAGWAGRPTAGRPTAGRRHLVGQLRERLRASVRAANGGAGREEEPSAAGGGWRSSPTPHATFSTPTSTPGSAHPLAASSELGATPLPASDPPPVHPAAGLSSAPEPAASPGPSATALNSVINQLEPDVLNNLAEIMKDIKKKSPQFYIHCTEPGDRVCEEVKEHLLRLGNVQQSPEEFLQQDASDNGLLVIIKNKDVAGHVHQIPGLVALKRHPSVVFVGVDSPDDVRNSSCIELFVSGGCVLSDELLLSPGAVSLERLAALMTLLEQHSSPESVWRWKIHCKTHKKLKEQARFRRDAANLLDLLSAYQKRQVVEFLPYHRCDRNSHQSPDLDCLIEHQARYSQFRHTVLLTEHPFDMFPGFSDRGIIVAGVEEILGSFSRLVGCHSVRDKQLLVEDLLAPKGVVKQSGRGDAVSGSEFFPSTFPEPPHLSSTHQPQQGPPPPGPHASDQLVPDPPCPDGRPLATSRDMEFLQQAIRHLRAERQEKLQQLRQQQQLLELQADLRGGAPHHPHPAQLAPPRTEGGGRNGGEQRERERERAGSRAASNSPSSGQTVAAVTGPSLQTEPESDGGGKTAAARGGEPEGPLEAKRGSYAEGGRQREEPKQADVPPPSSSSSAGDAKPAPAARMGVITGRELDPGSAQKPLDPGGLSGVPLGVPALGQPRGVGLLHTPHLAHLHPQPFLPGQILGPLGPLRGIGGLLGPSPLCPGGLGPPGAPVVWGFQQSGLDFLGGYYSPAGPGGVYRGGRRGGGFNGM